ncbi:uncharacterized protein LOC143187153 isoform X2 [Calliopsis andreniformis]|uniref:uncharacterized protein LOC143187153 isoform X2 n=1 Tax=Calliopsis andreniformis TaxID=337506 RepID=UPI003FCD903A
MQTQKCCAHCPGKLVTSKHNESHECCLPKYVSGNMRVSSLIKHVPSEYSDRRDTEKNLPKLLADDRPSCYDHFALAKRLHAENLEHQPLPDKVDDSVFKNVDLEKCCRRVSPGRRCSCCQRGPDDCKNLSRRYGPVLGCKKPETKMDLAICWETPIDPTYEPRRSTHIDGSEGGLAPAIFSLVQHTSNSRSILRSAKNGENCQGRCRVQERSNRSENKSNEESCGSAKCCCECLCKGLNKVSISRKSDEGRTKRSAPFRKCVACEPRNIQDDPRLIRSAVGLALGLEKQENRRNGTKVVVNGCRSTDYPEHWRLMTVYQQSYKNPFRRKIFR